MAPFAPTAEMPEPTLEWAVSRTFPGMRELLLLAHTMIERGGGVIIVQSNGVNAQGGARNATHDDFWPLMLDDVEDAEVALGPNSKWGVRLTEPQKAVKKQRAAWTMRRELRRAGPARTW